MDWSNLLNTSLASFSRSPHAAAFKRLPNNHARVLHLLSSLDLRQVDAFIALSTAQSAKSASASDQLRLKGNQAYANKSRLHQAFSLYTEALRFAPVHPAAHTYAANQSLVLAFSNRSAVLFEQGLFEASLEDIRWARAYFGSADQDCSVQLFNLAFKLMTREKKCLVGLNRHHQLAQLMDTGSFYSLLASGRFAADNESKLATFREEILAEAAAVGKEGVQKRQKIACSVSGCVDVRLSAEKGRHCLAARDIGAGEVLFVEEPYSAVLLPEFTHQYCHTCFKRVYDGRAGLYRANTNAVFCQRCVEVVFCSGECRSADRSHEIECTVLKSLLHNLGIGHLAFRVVADTDQATLGKYAAAEKVRSSQPDAATLMAIDYRNSSPADYEQVYYLMTHEESSHYEDLFKYALTSILLARCYRKSK